MTRSFHGFFNFFSYLFDFFTKKLFSVGYQAGNVSCGGIITSRFQRAFEFHFTLKWCRQEFAFYISVLDVKRKGFPLCFTNVGVHRLFGIKHAFKAQTVKLDNSFVRIADLDHIVEVRGDFLLNYLLVFGINFINEAYRSDAIGRAFGCFLVRCVLTRTGRVLSRGDCICQGE